MNFGQLKVHDAVEAVSRKNVLHSKDCKIQSVWISRDKAHQGRMTLNKIKFPVQTPPITFNQFRSRAMLLAKFKEQRFVQTYQTASVLLHCLRRGWNYDVFNCRAFYPTCHWNDLPNRPPQISTSLHNKRQNC